jgi:hypothetical protein
MITMTWTDAPADLLGLGSAAVRPCTGVDAAMRAPITPMTETGLPFGGTAVRLRPGFAQAPTAARTTTFAHNSIAVERDGTPLGIHPSRRPLS